MKVAVMVLSEICTSVCQCIRCAIRSLSVLCSTNWQSINSLTLVLASICQGQGRGGVAGRHIWPVSSIMQGMSGVSQRLRILISLESGICFAEQGRIAEVKCIRSRRVWFCDLWWCIWDGCAKHERGRFTVEGVLWFFVGLVI